MALNSRNHIKKAIKLYNDHKNPDYNNAVKEAISSVEAKIKNLSDNSNKDFGNCVKFMKTKLATKQEKDDWETFFQPIERLYGWSSNHNDGIRHNQKSTDSHIKKKDARYCLILCSAILNWLTEQYDL